MSAYDAAADGRLQIEEVRSPSPLHIFELAMIWMHHVGRRW